MFKKFFFILTMVLLIMGGITGFRMAKIVHSEPVEQGSDDLEKVWQDIRQALEGIDLKKMEEELKDKTETLRRNFNNALESEKFKQTMAEIGEKLDALKRAIKEAGDSESVQKIREALEKLFKKLESEAPERSDIKI